MIVRSFIIGFAVCVLSACQPGLPHVMHNATSETVTVSFHSSETVISDLALQPGGSFQFGGADRADFVSTIWTAEYIELRRSNSATIERLSATALRSLIIEDAVSPDKVVVCIGATGTDVRVAGPDLQQTCEAGEVIGNSPILFQPKTGKTPA